MIKMVVSSFYNTLIDKEEAIPTSTMLEIDRIRKKGILFTICTNRLYKEVLDYNMDFPFIDYIISLNGDYIYDVKNSNSLSKSKLSKIAIKKINNIFKDYNITYYTIDNYYNDFSQIKDEDIYKIEIEITEDKEMEKIEKVNVNKSIFTVNNKKYLELSSNKSGMFSGVDKIGLKEGIDLKEIVVICANDSDLSLVQNCKESYAVENGSLKILKKAKKKTSSNNNKGVEQVLKML